MRVTHTAVAALLAIGLTSSAFAQQPADPTPPGETAATAPPAAAAPAQDDYPDLDVNYAQPDFTLSALPTTLRLPRHKSSFRVTHRFARPLGQGDIGDLFDNFFGLDNGALIGLEYRFGLFRATQVGFHRTSSSKTIQFFAQREIVGQSDTMPLSIDVIAAIEGTNNLRDNHSPSLGVLFSREVGKHAAFYLEPIWVNNTNPLPKELIDHNDTVFIGLGTRLRIRPTVYLVLEGSPRVGGFHGGRVDDPNVTQVSFGIEKRAGGHLFQLNFSNGLGTTIGQIARGGTASDDWYLGFNISRKFF